MRWFYGDPTLSVWHDPALQGALKHTLLLAVHLRGRSPCRSA